MNMNRVDILKTVCGFIVLNGIAASFAFAGSMDVGLINPKGEVILFYKEGDSITVKECVDLTILEKPSHREDCKQKPGTYKSKMSVAEFKNRLNAVLKFPVGSYTPLMKQKIKVYNNNKQKGQLDDLKGQLDDVVDLKRQQSEINSKIDRIKAFMEKYGKEDESLQAAKAKLEAQLAGIEQELADNVEPIVCSIAEVNQSIEDLIHKIVDSRSLTRFVYSQNKTSFEFNILKSYVDYPGISTATFAPVKAGTFLMGSPWNEVDQDDDEIQHKVILTQDFEIQTTEVTQLQYFLVIGSNPSYFKKEEYCSNETSGY